MDMPTYPGDPLSPGWASEEGARKLALSEVRTLSPIPVLPISYGDALPLLRNLGGPVAPESWRGALGITYHVGAGPARVHLALKFDWQTRPLYNVIARIPGATTPDQWIIHGNHHDAWVNGAEDPLSGMVAVEETARSLGALLETGWRPARTIILAGWDGEEWGLLGSTEWAEKHQEELKTKAVAYLNSDTNSEEFLSASGSHSLQAFVREVARDLKDPKTGKSVLATLLERSRDRQGATADSAFTISALGSGSDYTAFLVYLNIASLNLSYGGGGPSGIYHSIYDSFDFYTRFKDPTFAYGVLESQTMTTALLRLANAPVLPFEFTEVAKTYGSYVDEITKGAAAQDATKSLDLAAVSAAVDRLGRAATRWESARARTLSWTAADAKRYAKQLAAVNAELYATERALGDPAGLDQREWFRHLVYAPGFYTGYGVKTLPGIREAVEERKWDEAVEQVDRLAATLERVAEKIDEAAALLGGGP
jgi:N-acetylated-alpha-linked acidic dipeptidase